MDHAPIVIFAYNRPDTLRLVLEALRKNPEAMSSELYVYCDGPKKRDDPARRRRAMLRYEQVGAAVKDIKGFARVTVIRREENLGLARSVMAGVTEVCNAHARAIVVEDDIVTSSDFLAYMNSGLSRYADDPRVASIHGYMYPSAGTVDLPESFFLRGADCWGWGAWKRSWDLMEPDGKVLLARLREQGLEDLFNPGVRGPYLGMLQAQIDGKVDSWAIRWHASMFVRNMLTLYPRRSLVRNIGFGPGATHTSAGAAKRFDAEHLGPAPGSFPSVTEEDPAARAFMHRFFNDYAPPRRRARGPIRRGYRRLRSVVRRVLGKPDVPQSRT